MYNKLIVSSSISESDVTLILVYSFFFLIEFVVFVSSILLLKGFLLFGFFIFCDSKIPLQYSLASFQLKEINL